MREALAETWPWSAPGNELRCGFQVGVQSNNRVSDSPVSDVLTPAVPLSGSVQLFPVRQHGLRKPTAISLLETLGIFKHALLKYR